MELIDRTKLKMPKEAETHGRLEGPAAMFATWYRMMIMQAPVIDAEPVVRCKDCRWKEQEQLGMVYCPATVGGWVDEDWFCKGGERSEE